MSRYIRKLFHEFVYGGHLLSLGASGIVWTIVLVLDESGGWPIIILAYLISQIVYNLDHLSDANNSNDGNSERTEHLLNTKNIQKIIIGLYIISFFTVSMFTTVRTLFLGIVIILGGIVYTLKIKNLMRYVVGLKNIYIAFFWSMLGLLASFHYGLSISNTTVVALMIFVFLRWIVNSSFFDIKDEVNDNKNNIKTLPVVFGIKKTVYFLHFINLLSGVFLLTLIMYEIVPSTTLPLLLFTFYAYLYLNRAIDLQKKDLRKLSYVVVDGEYMFWPFSVLIGRML